MGSSDDVNEWSGLKGAVGGWLLASPLRRVLDLATGNVTSRVLDALRLSGDETVVEVGSGSGYYSLRIAERLDIGKIICVDGSEAMSAHLTRAARRRALDRRVEVRIGDAYELPVDDASADVAFTANLLHELAEPERALAELARVLRPGGRLVVTDFHDSGRNRERVRRSHHADAHGVFTVPELVALCRGAGFEATGGEPRGRWCMAWGRRPG